MTNQKNLLETYLGMLDPHPSGLSEDELAFVSAEFFSQYKPTSPNKEMWDRLLAFQKGWKACMDFYKIET